MPRDFEITRRYKPEPISKRQKSCIKKVDPTDYEIYSKKFELICREGRDMLMKMGISSMIQSGDLAVGLYTAEGDLASGWLGIHLHLVNGQLAIKYIVKHFVNDETVGVRPGDMFYVNEVFAGGIHNSDQLLVMPIFHEEELIGWSSASGGTPALYGGAELCALGAGHGSGLLQGLSSSGDGDKGTHLGHALL